MTTLNTCRSTSLARLGMLQSEIEDARHSLLHRDDVAEDRPRAEHECVEAPQLAILREGDVGVVVGLSKVLLDERAHVLSVLVELGVQRLRD